MDLNGFLKYTVRFLFGNPGKDVIKQEPPSPPSPPKPNDYYVVPKIENKVESDTARIREH